MLPRLVWYWGIDRLWAPQFVRSLGVTLGNKPIFHGMPVIHRHTEASIAIGDHILMNSRPSSNVLHLARPCTLAAIRPGAKIQIGNNVGMSGVTLVAADKIQIGDHTMIGAETTIVDTDFHPIDMNERMRHPTQGMASKPIEIGKNVFIGMHTLILKGVHIADGAVVGAGAVVTKDVAAGDIVAGNPARIVRTLNTDT